ncbi:unnamed protein product, partial [marine sediment metagenome]
KKRDITIFRRWSICLLFFPLFSSCVSGGNKRIPKTPTAQATPTQVKNVAKRKFIIKYATTSAPFPPSNNSGPKK